MKSIDLPDIGRRVDEVGKIVSLETTNQRLSARIEFGFPVAACGEEYASRIAALLREETGIEDVRIDVDSRIVAHSVQRNLKRNAEIRNIIAVASGKGGVGKSTVAVNLALALQAEGASVGILDADIYGPSVPHMVGLVGQRPQSDDGKTMDPLESLGLQVMSIGFLVDPDQPMVWRGPMVTSALNQLMNQTRWRGIDYLVVDMPPGTGDIQLTLSQQIPVAGAVIVTTPQDIAAIDARKGLAMFGKVSIPVLGIIENMAMHVCSACGHEEAIFGEGGGDKMAADFDVRLLGRLPLDAGIRARTDAGEPTVISEPGSAAADAFRQAARRTAATLATRDRDYSARFPNIVVEGS